ncbi:MAG: hypothetical protein JWM68_409 [Verrucomicrobiales bacterium]|nr:hypothetical protein [Verrucomicrobiales bacterium]
MRRIPSWGIVLAVILITAVFVGVGIGWWVSSDDTTPTVRPVIATSEDPHQTLIPAPVANSSAPTDSNKALLAKNAAHANVPDGTTSLAAEGWQEKLDEVLSGEGEADQKAARLLRMLPHLGEEAQVEVSQHLVNFVTDENYFPIAQIVTNAATSEAVSTVFMTDLLNRNDGLKLPLLLSMARNEAHPKHADAKELLELYLQENHGTDWALWETSVTNWLAQNGPNFTLQAPPEPTTTETNP